MFINISFACWIVLLIPQLIEQWKLKSADGIAIGCVVIWLFGDICNLIGAVWAHLLTPVILLAVWFLVIDGSLIVSYIYYTYVFPKRHKVIHVTVDETSELIPDVESGGPRRKSSVRSRRDSLSLLVLSSSHWSAYKKYGLPLLFVSLAGIVGYIFSPKVTQAPEGELPQLPTDDMEFGPQFFGYLSAACYLGARIPQIIHNYHRKSVYGLSLLFFLFSTFGNITYSLQILFFRLDKEYLILNASWLLGSLGATLEDTIIFIQFFIYEDHSHDNEVVEVVE